MIMTIRCGNQAEANHVSASIKLSSRPQSKNGRVFSQGEEDGFENKAEKRCDTAALYLVEKVSRVGKDDGGTRGSRHEILTHGL